jgi:predicted nucleic acid-binding protein
VRLVLDTATAGAVSCLVTGDQQLPALGGFRGIEILSPLAFYDRLRG